MFGCFLKLLQFLLKLQLSPGLTNYISGFNTMEEIVHKNVYNNLDVITAGNLTPNPAEMASSDAVFRLLDELKANYDFIFLDTPPVNVISDALPVIKNSDGTVLVVRPKYTTRSDLKNSMAQVEFIGGKILGVIANGVEIQKRGYGKYGHYGKYGAAYSSESTKKEKEATEDLPKKRPSGDDQ